MSHPPIGGEDQGLQSRTRGKGPCPCEMGGSIFHDPEHRDAVALGTRNRWSSRQYHPETFHCCGGMLPCREVTVKSSWGLTRGYCCCRGQTRRVPRGSDVSCSETDHLAAAPQQSVFCLRRRSTNGLLVTDTHPFLRANRCTSNPSRGTETSTLHRVPMFYAGPGISGVRYPCCPVELSILLSFCWNWEL